MRRQQHVPSPLRKILLFQSTAGSIRKHIGSKEDSRFSLRGRLQQMRDALRIAAVQHRLRRNDEDPVQHAKYVVDLMKRQAEKDRTASSPRIDLWVLPELSPIGYSEHTFENYLNQDNNEVHGEIQMIMQQAAHDLDNSLVCFGCIGRSANEDAPAIRQIVVNGNGQVCCTYDKISICDYGDCNESRFFVAGTEFASFDVGGGFRIGILICADMRNPLLANQLTTKHNVDVIIQPAAFSRDVSFYSWKSFRETRAVENSVYFLGVNYAGDNFGESSMNPPWIDEGHLPTSLSCEEGCLISTVSRSVLDQVRSTFPYRQRLLQQDRGV